MLIKTLNSELKFGLVRALGRGIYVGPARARPGSFEGCRGFMLIKASCSKPKAQQKEFLQARQLVVAANCLQLESQWRN